MSSRWPLNPVKFSHAALGFALASLPFSVFACHAFLVVFITLWVFEGNWSVKLALFKKNPLIQLLLIFILVLAAGLTYTQDRAAGWFLVEKKIFLLLIPVAIATSTTLWSQREIRSILYFFAASCAVAMFICVAHGLYQLEAYWDLDPALQASPYLNAHDFNIQGSGPDTVWLFLSYTALTDVLGLHPSYLAIYVAFCIAFLLHELLTRDFSKAMKVLTGSLIFVFTIFVVCLSARIVIFSLIAIYITIAGHFLLRRQRRWHAVMILALLVVIGLSFYANPVSRYRSFQEMANSAVSVNEGQHYRTSLEIRASLWWLGWKSFQKNNSLTGAGTGDVREEMNRSSRQYGITNILNSHDPHNQYLYILIGNGIPALALFLTYMLWPLFRAWRQKDYLMMAFTFLFAALCFTETALELQKGIVFFAIVHSMLAFHWPAGQADEVKIFSGARS